MSPKHTITSKPKVSQKGKLKKIQSNAKRSVNSKVASPKSKECRSMLKTLPESTETPPQWASTLMEKIDSLTSRVNELEKTQNDAKICEKENAKSIPPASQLTTPSHMALPFFAHSKLSRSATLTSAPTQPLKPVYDETKSMKSSTAIETTLKTSCKPKSFPGEETRFSSTGLSPKAALQSSKKPSGSFMVMCPCVSKYHATFSSSELHGSKKCPFCSKCHILETLFNGCKEDCGYDAHTPSLSRVQKLLNGHPNGVLNVAENRQKLWEKGKPLEKTKFVGL